MEDGRIDSLRVVDCAHGALGEVAGIGCEQSRKVGVEWLVEEKADAVSGVEFDDVERGDAGESESRPYGQQRVSSFGDGVDQVFVIVAEWVDMLATAGPFEERVEVCQDGRVGVQGRSQT